MGTWNAGLFSNDTTCDVKDTYIECLKQQLSNEEAYRKTYEEYEELIGTDEEPLFWYALADTQWNAGRLMPEVKDKALECIQNKGGLDFWEERPKGALKWQKTMQKLNKKIESPMPPEKKFPKPIVFKTNPWNIGDVYAYQFHSKQATELGLSGKYILIQKLADIEYFENTIYSVVQVFDRVFDSMPNLAMIEGVRILPLVDAAEVCGTSDNLADINPSLEWYMKAIVNYYKIREYPRKYMTFIGNITISEINCQWNSCTEFYWDELEDRLVDYYLSWQNVIY